MNDIPNPYQEPRKQSQGEQDARLADNLTDLIMCILKRLRKWVKK